MFTHPTFSSEKAKPGDNKEKLLLLAMIDKEEDTKREIIAQRLFERSHSKDYGTLKSCLAGGFNECFKQSEQAFLSCLEDPESGMYIPPSPPFLPAGVGGDERSVVVQSVDLYLYSYLDICRICRGTMSHMLFTKKINKSIESFLEKISPDITFGENYTLKILAFGHKVTTTGT